ncbi:hypothetical protein F2Q70_00038730 [Brassica cretica]|uniref:Uncharacterized protein n=1 Tax=Brassica cretica TaxID=69181 RepID=A0A8S9K8Q1_BRACR|nr:hypothetical protein F2Q70_00038730 [Brassica cretica]
MMKIFKSMNKQKNEMFELSDPEDDDDDAGAQRTSYVLTGDAYMAAHSSRPQLTAHGHSSQLSAPASAAVSCSSLLRFANHALSVFLTRAKT